MLTVWSRSKQERVEPQGRRRTNRCATYREADTSWHLGVGRVWLLPPRLVGARAAQPEFNQDESVTWPTSGPTGQRSVASTVTFLVESPRQRRRLQGRRLSLLTLLPPPPLRPASPLPSAPPRAVGCCVPAKVPAARGARAARAAKAQRTAASLVLCLPKSGARRPLLLPRLASKSQLAATLFLPRGEKR